MRSTDAHEPVWDLAVSEPQLGRLRALVQQRDWPAASDLLGDIAGAGEDQLAVAADVIAETPGVETFLDEVVSNEPENAGARVLRANRRIVLAWDARSSLASEHVTADQFARFHEGLREAEADLIRLCAIVPWMGLPWMLRLMTARGLELGPSEVQRRYERLAKHHPEHFTGQKQRLQSLCPKWGGTWEQAFAFAHTCTENAAPGRPNHALRAIVHFERWRGLDAKDRNRYFTAAIVEELQTAATRSALDPAFVGDLNRVNVHTLFAMVFSLAQQPDRARAHFEALGDAADRNWYGYLGDPAAAYRSHRAAAFGRGRT